MSRIGACFDRLKAARKKGLITFITAGDPDMASTVPLMHALVEAGSDIIEIGVPFSDPMAEGPVIQRASERALANGAYLPAVLRLITEFRRKNTATPLVLMGYLNPVEYYGYERFAADAAAAGVDGVITVDMPVDEAQEYRAALLRHQIDPVFLLAPTSPDRRIELVSRMGAGFVYYVSLKGVTGADHMESTDVGEKMTHIRTKIPLPLAVGFGIKDSASVQRVAGYADAVVVGSAVIQRIEQAINDKVAQPGMIDNVKKFVAQLRRALDETTAA